MNVLDIRSGPVRKADSSSDRAAHGKSGRVSTLSQVSCCPWSARHHCGDALACVLHQGHALPRRTGIGEPLPGGERRSVSGCRQVRAALGTQHDTPDIYLDFYQRTSNGSGARFSPNILESNASGWHRFLSCWLRRTFRIACNGAETYARVSVAAIELSANRRPNTISRSLYRHQKLFHNVRNVGVFSCLK